MFWLLVILIVIVLWLVKVYNKLQSSMQNIREGFSNLQAGLKKRQQLSGQIIEIASGYLEHEQVTQLRVAQSQNTQQLAAMRRENYNNRVKQFNSYRNSFPAVLVAQKLSFGTVDYFDSDDEKFDAQVQNFARDDSAVLQEIIGSSAKAVKNISSQAVQVVQGNKKQLGNQTNDVTPPSNSADNTADTPSEKPE